MREKCFTIPVAVIDAHPHSRPLMIYDGDCDFCSRWIARWHAMTGDRIEYAPYQLLADALPHLTCEQLAKSIHLIVPNGDTLNGAHAVFRALSMGAQKHWPLRLYQHVPGIAQASELAYRVVASHRKGMSVATRLLWGSDITPPSYLLTRWMFIRMIGMIYFVAFASLGVQIMGLIGSNGILPAAHYLETMRQRMGSSAYLHLPTLAWLDCSDEALLLMCGAGAFLSLLVVLRFAPALLLVILWALYLSLYQVGQTFLSFQWDLLLLESGFLAIFFAPWKLRPRLSSEPPPSALSVWLIRWLLFRLMFCSGVVKLLHDDPANPSWHHLTALTYHYETQCIPHALSWYAHNLPLWFHKFSILSMFAIEIIVPFLFFLPRRPRLFAFGLQVLLQLAIIMTGNYNFFNLLTIALCLSLVDDTVLARIVPKNLADAIRLREPRDRPGALQKWIMRIVTILIVTVSGIWMVETFHGFRNLPPVAQDVLRVSVRFASINSYGLFRRMTTTRPEIIVEGSRDKKTWLAYEFKWKPGDLKRRPAFVAPHQPRLDWQMWFAALGDYRQPRNQWFISFLKRLLEGSPEVLELLQDNPFPEKPPQFVRAVLFDYRFTDFATRQEKGTWWTRRRLRQYTPVLSLKSFGR